MRILERYRAYESKTFADAAELYLAEVSGVARRRQEYALRAVLPYIGDMPLLEIDDYALCNYKDDRCREVMVGTINKELTTVKTVLNKAAKVWRWIPAVPAIQKIAGQSRKPYPLTRSEERKLLHQLKGRMRDVRPIAQFVLNTGLKREEIFRLRWVDEREVNGVELLTLDERDGRTRPVVLNSVSRKIVQAMSGCDAEFVIPQRPVSKQINIAWHRAGLPNHPLIRKGIDNLRCTYAHRLRLAGATEDESDTLLGLRYLHREQRAAAVDLRRLAELVERVITVEEPDLPVYYQTH